MKPDCITRHFFSTRWQKTWFLKNFRKKRWNGDWAFANSNRRDHSALSREHSPLTQKLKKTWLSKSKTHFEKNAITFSSEWNCFWTCRNEQTRPKHHGDKPKQPNQWNQDTIRFFNLRIFFSKNCTSSFSKNVSWKPGALLSRDHSPLSREHLPLTLRPKSVERPTGHLSTKVRVLEKSDWASYTVWFG